MMHSMANFRVRLIGAGLSLLAVLAFGTFGFWFIGDGVWGVFDCFYMTVISVTTVGFGEVLEGFTGVKYARGFSALVIFMGMGVFLYFASTVTAFIIEGDLRRALRDQRTRKKIRKMKNHVIVCGAGSTGSSVVEELVKMGTSTVVIDTRQEMLNGLPDENHLAVIHGDATLDRVLEEAKLEEASSLVASLPNDKDNLFLVVAARQSNPEIRIIARCSDVNVISKLKKAGADAVISPNHIGGLRMVSEIIRPTAVKFFEMLRDGEGAIRFEEVIVKGELEGKTLGQLDLRNQHGVTVLAIQESSGEFLLNPSAKLQLAQDMKLIILGDEAQVRKVEEMTHV